MECLHFFQFFIYSICVNLFSLFISTCNYACLLLPQYLEHNIKEEYDFVIVGSGSAGSHIAQRLSETNYSYIVLEAGGHGNFLLDIPVLGPLLHGSLYDWQFEMAPQDNACFAMNNNVCKLPQGRIVGGSSKLNNMIYVRGNISHYVNMFDNKLEYKYLEDQFELVEKKYLHLEKIRFKSNLSSAVLNAARELGLSNRNVSKEFAIGFDEVTVMQDNGKRWTTSNHKINVASNIRVEKVLLRENKAYGVKLKNGIVLAKKGVILSAGTFNSPKLLQLSGIGPKELLEFHGVEIVKDLPVGRNLQDHVTTGLDLILTGDINYEANSILNLFNVFNYFVNAEGPLTSPGCEVIGFLSTRNTSEPDIQFMVLPVGITSDFGTHLRNVLNIKDDVWGSYFSQILGQKTVSILPILLHPNSRGYVAIKSKDPEVQPLIDPQYLSNKNDIELLIKGLKLVLSFINTKALNEIHAKLNSNQLKSCKDYDFLSDSYLECYIRHLTLTSYHPVGTCSMGSPESKSAVLDTSFKVIGIDNLYVVDASVLPTLPSGNINAAIIVMANIFFLNVVQNL